MEKRNVFLFRINSFTLKNLRRDNVSGFTAKLSTKWRDPPAKQECHPRWDSAVRSPGTVWRPPQAAGTGGRRGRRSGADPLLSVMARSWLYPNESLGANRFARESTIPWRR